MGFLNHATNNIIIDAVLTERGRELLSRNDGSFNIRSFSFGDDEVDYSLISKYGPSIGKEKIEKNTPIFEANPNENLAIKYPLISFPNPLLRLNQLPTLVRDDSATNETVQLFDTRLNEKTNSGIIATIKVKNSVNATDITALDKNITDRKFFVKMHGELIKMENGTFIDTDLNGIDTYEISTAVIKKGSSEWNNQIFADITFFTNGVVSASSFKEFAIIGSNLKKINTSIQVIGASSGASIVIPVLITKRNSSS
jgi:hypothetical protein